MSVKRVIVEGPLTNNDSDKIARNTAFKMYVIFTDCKKKLDVGLPMNYEVAYFYALFVVSAWKKCSRNANKDDFFAQGIVIL